MLKPFSTFHPPSSITLTAAAALALMMLLPTSTLSAAVLGDDTRKAHPDRVLQGTTLSEKTHFVEEDGAAEQQHDQEYDHEAFLGGQEAAEEFDALNPEESIRRLAIIVDKIDKDGDSFVTLEEMRSWIHFTQQRHVKEDVDRQWKQYNVSDDGSRLRWESYREELYGFLDADEKAEEGEDVGEKEEQASYRKMEHRDLRRWDLADEDKDSALTKLEFQHFLHPEDADHMRDIVVQETLEDMDKDGDGKISPAEYIGDMYRGDLGESEPDWVKSEREQFEQFRDRNGDGFMDLEEMKVWIMPPDFDHSEAEARHLVNEADEDQDGRLSKGEILDKYDLFVGSQATDFGEALTRHEEF